MSKPDLNSKITPKPTPSLDARLKELEAATEWFYSDEFTLDQAIAHYKSAIKLADGIEQDLEKLKNEVTLLADFTKDN